MKIEPRLEDLAQLVLDYGNYAEFEVEEDKQRPANVSFEELALLALSRLIREVGDGEK